MKNMKKGVELFHEVVQKDEPKICLKTDCDTDGFSSSALIYEFIKYLNPKAKIECILSYNKEHGLTYKMISNYTRNAFDLIIIPDASMETKEAIQITQNFDAPIIVLDHHLQYKEYQDQETGKWISEKEAQEIMDKGGIVKEDCYMDYCIAINDTDGNYPNPTLSGVGVVLKFCEAYCDTYGIDIEVLKQWYDLVATGIVADSMSLKDKETRYYVMEGIKEENLKNEFLNEIQRQNPDEFKFGRTIENTGWKIGPLINGCIRYGKEKEQNDTFRAIRGDNKTVEYQPRRKSKNDPIPDKEIHTLQWDMARVCSNVKSRQDTAVRSFMNEIEEKIADEDLLDNSVLFVDCSNIIDKKTVSGLVANKLATKYMRPVVLMREKNSQEFGGSARGYDKGNIENLNEFLSNLGISCAGHSNAFGLSFAKKDLDDIIKQCNKLMPVSSLTTTYPVDWEIKAKDLKKSDVYDVAENYIIWGNDIPQPTFAITDLHINASNIFGYGEHNGFIRFTYNGIPFIKKYCPNGDYERMTMQDRNTFGTSKKNLVLNIIGQFVLNAWEDKVIPQVKILQYDVCEDIDFYPDLGYTESVQVREKKNSGNEDESKKVVKKSEKKVKKEEDWDDFVF